MNGIIGRMNLCYLWTDNDDIPRYTIDSITKMLMLLLTTLSIFFYFYLYSYLYF